MRPDGAGAPVTTPADSPLAAAPRWARADAYLFDIDGTLLNSRDGVHYHAFHNAVRAVFGVDSHIDGVPVHGNTDIGILRAVLRREGVPAADIERGIPRAVEHMCAEVRRQAADVRPELCPSVRELLERLRQAGRILGIVSGNLEAIGWTKLEAAGLRPFFSFGAFSDCNELREDIFRAGIREAAHLLGRPAEVCIVGDTPSDIRAARAAGVPVIAVATGIYTQQDLRALAPDLCISCCTEFLEQLRS
jgi:phosphoglycolate phosphatase-like HAD superfamily hydrolase